VSSEMIDWNLVVTTANKFVRPGPQVTDAEARDAVAELRRHAVEAEGHVRSFTGLSAAGASGPVLIVDRPGWVQANVDGFRVVLQPLLDKLASRRSDMPGGGMISGFGSKVTALELGSLLAFLASKVLGQYETFARTEGQDKPPGRLLLVAPNVVHTEREMDVDPRDFRLWVCIHEETHRTQFTAVPWLRDHLEGEVHAFLAETDVDPSAVIRRLRDAVETLAGAARGHSEVSLIDVVQTPAQRAILDRLTAVMSLLEGHADYVMDGVGPAVIPTVAEIRQKFQRRRAGVGRLDQAMRRLLGLDAKLRQYRDGEKFVREVVAQVGMEGFNRVWTSPNTLPTKTEILNPAAWVSRVHGRSALEGTDPTAPPA
jgi:coenzyme F420 biosynthesis associated uncharacterized protein